MIPLTFSSLGCAELSLDEVAALARRHSFRTVELRALAGTTELPTWLSARFESPAAWASHLQTLELSVIAFGTSFRLLNGKEADRAALLAFVPWAEAAGVPWLRIFDGGQTGDAAELAHAAEVFAWWRDERRRNGWKVDLMVETHDALVTTPRLQAFFNVIPDAALLWDTHHTWKKGGEDPVATWRAVGARTVHIHVKDSVSRASDRHPFTYVLPGEGEFPMVPLLAELKSSGYQGAVSLEWERLWHPYLPTLETALAAAAKHHWW
ncbi:MAG: TIM barrel protein [Opitutaceae bacterium]|jgi:sugar phosphate isomerase/epimerase